MHHSKTKPAAPSTLAEEPIPPAVDEVILACLAKAPADRPANADVLWERLNATRVADRWEQHDARSWWEHHEPDVIEQT
jgi:hypothetical protein